MKKQRGIGLIEVLAALVVGTVIFSSYARMAGDAQRQTKDTVTAQHFKQVSDAATRYIQDNSATVQANATATVPATITTAMLTATNYLPAGFSGTNPYGQSLQVEVLQPIAGNLQATVLSVGGTTIPDAQAPRIAAKVGASGGYTPAASPATAQGSFGGWTMPLTNNTQPGAGHLVGSLYFNNGQLVTDYLRRHSVAGHPELNTMYTPLVMSSTQTIGAACSPTGAIAQDGAGTVVSCKGGIWQGGAGGLTWKGTVAAMANLPAAGNSSGDAYRIANLSNHIFVWDAVYSKWEGLVVDSNGNLSLPGLIYANGSNSTFGAITMQGSKNGWSGINFKDASGNNSGTLMMHPTYSGFFNAADNNWRFLVDDAGNSQQNGAAASYYVSSQFFSDSNNGSYYVDPNNGSHVNYMTADNEYIYGNGNTSDMYIRAIGKWVSQLGSGQKGNFQINYAGGCQIGNPYSGGCWCPAGSNPALAGVFYLNGFWSSQPDYLYQCYS